MPIRKTPLIKGEYYHVFNRGVNKMQIFNSTRDYNKFLQAMVYYQSSEKNPKLSLQSLDKIFSSSDNRHVEIISYCLMPNHFHMLLKQLTNSGISEFIRKLGNSYSRYFNTKHKRSGPLFQGPFKSVHIDNIEQLLHVSRYIYLNPIVGGVIEQLDNYKWSSYLEHMGVSKIHISRPQVILEHFSSNDEYITFIQDRISYGKNLEAIKHLTID